MKENRKKLNSLGNLPKETKVGGYLSASYRKEVSRASQEIKKLWKSGERALKKDKTYYEL